MPNIVKTLIMIDKTSLVSLVTGVGNIAMNVAI
jgi:hypothetical protein